ncbi:MAG: peptidylprolyl isomerase [Bacillota bacterium]|nr:peptidylprolyl isomerase [Bacillota bacterium]
MSTKKKAQQAQLSKTDRQRQERAERIASLRDKDGGKRKIRTGSRFGRVAFPITAAVIVLAAVAWSLFSFGVIHSRLTVMTVKGDGVETKVGINEYKYHYSYFYETYNYYAQQDWVARGADGKIDLNAASGMEVPPDSTWGEYISYQAEQSLKQVIAYEHEARKMGLELTDKDRQEIDDTVAQIRTNYPDDLSFTTYLEARYGRSMTEAKLRGFLERERLANRYVSEQPKSYEIAEADLEAYYEEHPDDYDRFSYREFRLETPAAEQGASQEDVDRLQAETAAKAEEMLGKITDGDSFAETAKDYANEEEIFEYINLDPTLKKDVSIDKSLPAEVRTWLLDSARQENDKTLITDGGTHYILLFEGRQRDETLPASVRHILFAAREGEATAADLEAAKALADAALAQITDEASMEQVSEEALADHSATEATLYEDVVRGQMVEPFENWLFAPERKVGDTGIVQTVYGYHVMYYVGQSETPTWAKKIDEILRQERFSEESDALLASYTAEVSGFALRLVN